eukprot:5151925-Pyramimonas_sp.AAC.1
MTKLFSSAFTLPYPSPSHALFLAACLSPALSLYPSLLRPLGLLASASCLLFCSRDACPAVGCRKVSLLAGLARPPRLPDLLRPPATCLHPSSTPSPPAGPVLEARPRAHVRACDGRRACCARLVGHRSREHASCVAVPLDIARVRAV